MAELAQAAPSTQNLTSTNSSADLKATSTGTNATTINLSDAARANGATAPATTKLDLLVGGSSTITNSASLTSEPKPKNATEAKHMELALDSHKQLEPRLKAYGQLPDELQDAVYKKLSTDDRKHFPSQEQQKITKEVKEKDNKDEYRGEQFAKLPLEQQKALTHDIGNPVAKRIIAAWETKLSADMRGPHTDAEIAALKTQRDELKVAKEGLGVVADSPHQKTASEKKAEAEAQRHETAAEKQAKQRGSHIGNAVGDTLEKGLLGGFRKLVK